MRRALTAGCLSFATLCGGSWACAGSTVAPSAVPLGVWGGDHVTMTVTDTATHLEFDCAHGDIPGTLEADSRRQFTALGTYVREHGGPVREDEAADARPAIYAGAVQSTRLTLSIRLRDTGEFFGPFTLTHDVVGRVVKCL